MSADADAPATGESDGDAPPAGESDADAAESEFPTPPRTFTDDEGRAIRLRAGGGTADERRSLAAMYDTFGHADRAQGIPPANPRRRRQWLDRLGDGVSVVASHDGRAVGHGILLDGDDGHELALFVRPGYRRAGIGSAVLRTLLGRGRAAGVERVWLSVRRANRPALDLYRTVGFRADGEADADLGMALRMCRPL